MCPSPPMLRSSLGHILCPPNTAVVVPICAAWNLNWLKQFAADFSLLCGEVRIKDLEGVGDSIHASVVVVDIDGDISQRFTLHGLNVFISPRQVKLRDLTHSGGRSWAHKSHNGWKSLKWKIFRRKCPHLQSLAQTTERLAHPTCPRLQIVAVAHQY